MYLKNYLKKLQFLLLFASFCSLSCESDSEEPAETVVPTVVISNISSSSTSVSFTLTPADANQYYYSVGEWGDEEEFVQVYSSKSKDITLNNLTSGVEYTITAYAISRDDVVGDKVFDSFFTETTTTYSAKALAYKFTGTWCVNCIDATAALDDAYELLDGNLVIVGTHIETETTLQEKYETDEGYALCTEWNISAFPTTYLNYRESISTSSGLEIERSVLDSFSNYPAYADIAISSEVVNSKALITVNVKFGATSRYKIGVIIVENNIYEPNTFGSEDGYYHHVARQYLTDGSGDSFSTTIDNGTQRELSYECSLSSDWAQENLEVVVFVQKEYTTNMYYTTNVDICSIEGSVDFE